jgi:hypothetical protein
MPEVKAVEAALDSLGFDTEIATDPHLPAFALLVVRNPFRASAHAMGVLLWFRGERAFQQGFELTGGRNPIMRVWWNGDPDAPYEWAIVDHGGDDRVRARFFLFRLVSDGGFWRPGQYEGHGPDLSAAHEVAFSDINGDGIPELVAWLEDAPDTLFESCTGCPKRLVEHIYTERKYEGFALHDSRVVPTPYSVFVLFVHLLVDHNRAAAARLLDQPAKLDEAVRLGWGTRRSPGTWKLELTEEAQWPAWLQFSFRGPRGREHYVVRFTRKDARWVIGEWKRAARAPAAAGAGK